MLAWMNDEALRRTLTTGRATYYSRSRGTLWVKGETSGHHQYVRSVALDCDGDTLLVQVDQIGAGLSHRRADLFPQPHRPDHIRRSGDGQHAGRGTVTTGVVTPDEKTFHELARTNRVVPVTRRLLADGETPVGVYRKLAGGPGTFLLESAEHGAASGAAPRGRATASSACAASRR